MKKIILFLLFYSNIQFAFCQESNKNESALKEVKGEIETTVITIDLSEPHINSVKNSDKINKLVVKNRNPLAFNLINGNPFRYRYALNYKKINLFTNETFNPSALDLEKNTTNQPALDSDSDGIPDQLDKDPSISNVMTKEVIFAMQNTTSKELLKLKSSIEKFISSISDDSKLNINEFNLMTSKFKDSYVASILEINVIQDNISKLAPTDSTVDKKQEELKAVLESIRLLIDKLVSTKNKAFLLPIDINGDNIDYIEVQLDIYDGDNETPQTYTYKVWIKGGVKIDVSGGVFITSLFDKEYYTTDSTGDAKLLFEEDNGNYDFGFGTMVHVSLRGGSWVRPALNFGVLFTSNQKFQMLAGFGLILGKSERLILNAGISMGRVSVLSDNYEADGVTPYNLGTDGSIPLNDKFEFGNFFGITYNFNKPKSNKD